MLITSAFPVRVPVEVQPVPVPILANVPGKAKEDGSSTWVLDIYVGAVPASQLWPRPALAFATGMEQTIGQMIFFLQIFYLSKAFYWFYLPEEHEGTCTDSHMARVKRVC